MEASHKTHRPHIKVGKDEEEEEEEEEVKFKTSIIMFKAYHNVLPDSLQKMFNLRVQIYDTRQKCTFSVHRAHTNVKSMCISIYGVKLWNSLHTDLTNCRSVHVFKKMYKMHIISLY